MSSQDVRIDIVYTRYLIQTIILYFLLPGIEVHSPLSTFLRLRGPLASDLPIGDVLKKKHKGSDLVIY